MDSINLHGIDIVDFRLTNNAEDGHHWLSIIGTNEADQDFDVTFYGRDAMPKLTGGLVVAEEKRKAEAACEAYRLQRNAARNMVTQAIQIATRILEEGPNPFDEAQLDTLQSQLALANEGQSELDV